MLKNSREAHRPCRVSLNRKENSLILQTMSMDDGLFELPSESETRSCSALVGAKPQPGKGDNFYFDEPEQAKGKSMSWLM